MTHFDEICKEELNWNELSDQGKNKMIRKICQKIKKLEEKKWK